MRLLRELAGGGGVGRVGRVAAELEAASAVARSGTAPEAGVAAVSLVVEEEEEDLQLMTWLGLVVSDELRAKIAAACSTVHVVGGKEGPDEALDWLRRGVCSLPGVSSSVLRSCSTSLAAT